MNWVEGDMVCLLCGCEFGDVNRIEFICMIENKIKQAVINPFIIYTNSHLQTTVVAKMARFLPRQRSC